MVPWDAIRDDTVVVPEEPGWDGPEQFWESVTALAEAHRRTARGEVHVDVWVEAAGMLPRIAAIADGFGVRVIGSGGFSSVTARVLPLNGLRAIGTPSCC